MVDEKELKLTAKNILTSIPEESTDFKICFGVLDQVVHNCITDSLFCDLDQVTQLTLDFSFLVCEIRELDQMTWGFLFLFFLVFHNQNAVTSHQVK